MYCNCYYLFAVFLKYNINNKIKTESYNKKDAIIIYCSKKHLKNIG